MSAKVHVIKLGGSLLDLSDLPARFDAFMKTWVRDSAVLVVGGAEAADVVRRFDAMFAIGESTSHWLAVRAMQLNAHLMKQVVREGELVSDPGACEKAWQASRLAIVDPLIWLQTEETNGTNIPHRWSFTSDSIAAHIAVKLKASRLTLLKSTLIDLNAISEHACTDVMSIAAAQGIVDGEFAGAAKTIPNIDIINLRHASLATDCAFDAARCWLRGGN